ncbi:MAG: pyruvate/2-oxoglutarate dehydrogenase complex dihydrolipoamide acyltransferase (E2) component, partial [Myxococcota bacterium]
MSVIEIRVPDIGEFDSVEVIEILVAPGDTVEVEQSLITLESDKATMEIPSTHAGTVQSIAVAIAGNVSEGDVILRLDVAGAAPEPSPADAAADSKTTS